MRLKIFLSIIFITVISLQLQAQFKYPKGVYMSLEEIKTKTPSENWELEIEKRPMSDIHFSGGNDYKLVSPDKSIKRKVLRKKVLAYSDGDSLYLNCLPYKALAWYAKVESDGPYLLVRAALSADMKNRDKQLDPSYNAYGQFGAIGGAIGGRKLAELRFVYALDKTTNEFIYIYEEPLKDILKNNKELLDQYQKEKEPNSFEVLMNYMKLFNEKNIGEISN